LIGGYLGFRVLVGGGEGEGRNIYIEFEKTGGC
jgi:hypothetical protein